MEQKIKDRIVTAIVTLALTGLVSFGSCIKADLLSGPKVQDQIIVIKEDIERLRQTLSSTDTLNDLELNKLEIEVNALSERVRRLEISVTKLGGSL